MGLKQLELRIVRLIVLLLIIAIVIPANALSAHAISQSNKPQPNNLQSDNVLKRYYLLPTNVFAGFILKSSYLFKDDLPKGFTAEISMDSLSFAEELANVQEVKSYTLPTDELAAATQNCVNGMNIPSKQIPDNVWMMNGAKGGNDVNIAVLDTGLFAHSDINPKKCLDAVSQREIADETEGVKSCDDADGHGTFIAGIIAAHGGQKMKGIFGIAPEANIWAIKTCSNGICYSDDIAKAIYYAVDNGVNIILMSFVSDTDNDPILQDAIDYAYSRNVMLIAPVGNNDEGSKDNSKDKESSKGSIAYPAAYEKVVAVGAVDGNKNHASFSSLGANSATMSFVKEERDVEFGAPGVDIESTTNDGCYGIASGTGIAAAHIAGIAAILWNGNAQETRELMHKYAMQNKYALQNDIAPESGDNPYTGFGLPVKPQ